MEIWKDIPGFEGRYQASTLGRLRSLDRLVAQRYSNGRVIERLEPGALISARLDKHGYLTIFSRELPTSLVSRLVALTFLENPEAKPQVNHLNGVTTDNRPDNLEWATNSENHLHAFKVLGRKANRNGRKKVVLTKSGRFALHFDSAAGAARALGVVPTAITNAAHRRATTQGFRVGYV